MVFSSLAEQDSATIWHPFTHLQTARSPIAICRGRGLYLYDEKGEPYLDAISSWWVNLHGHTHPYIVKSIQKQLEELEHVIFADFTHAPAIELATRLLEILPGNMSKIFYSDNGSTAVEVALKMALQYWYNRGTERQMVICLKNSYHGDTFGAMSAAGKNRYNEPFWKKLFEVQAVDSVEELQDVLEMEKGACFIFEPLILGAGGMIIYSASKLNQLLKLCHKYEVITIADEVMTGFGRTGPLFASEYLEEKPDLICLSKGLTGGFLPLGVTACREKIYRAFLGESHSQAFLHGHSYTANPLACASALASLDLLQMSSCTQQRAMIAKKHAEACSRWQGHAHLLRRCETLGTILVLEFINKSRDELYAFFLQRHILLRPIGNVLYLMPPYCITEDELQKIYKEIDDLLY